VSDSPTPILTAEQIASEESNRYILARALAAKSAAFEAAQQPVVAATPEPKTPLAAALSKLATPAPIAPPRDLASTQMQLTPILRKARELLHKYDTLKSEVGDKADDYAQLDMARIVKILPPTTDSENWTRLNALVGAAREIARTFTATNYSEMARLVGVVQQFADGTISEYQDPHDRSRALYNPGVAIRYTTEQVAKFANTVNSLATNFKTVTLMEPLVAADLLLVQAAPVVPEVAPSRMPLHQKLPKDRPTSSAVDFDPREPTPQHDDSVRVEQIADGFHTTTTQRRAE
jgi:hypothetical protein